MAVLVVGGGGRGTGKTAVGCALIAALPEFQWTAVKVTAHDHGTGDGIYEETDRHSEKDTGRYLRAGAGRAFLLSPPLSTSAEDLLRDLRAMVADGNASARDALARDGLARSGFMIESNRVRAESLAGVGEATVTLAAVAGTEEACKQSLSEHMGRVDAVVVSGGMAAWEFAPPFLRRPVFSGVDGRWAEPGLVRFVRQRLLGS